MGPGFVNGVTQDKIGSMTIAPTIAILTTAYIYTTAPSGACGQPTAVNEYRYSFSFAHHKHNNYSKRDCSIQNTEMRRKWVWYRDEKKVSVV